MNNNEKQFLTNNQIDNILEIVMRDNVYPLVNKTIKDIETSDEFKNKVEELKSSEEFVAKYKLAEDEYNNNLKLYSLFKQINEISLDKDLLYYTDNYQYRVPISYLVTINEKSLKDKYENYIIKTIDNMAFDRIREEYKLRENYDICKNIKLDLKARLLLITPGTYDEIINEIIPVIDINKYLYLIEE